MRAYLLLFIVLFMSNLTFGQFVEIERTDGTILGEKIGSIAKITFVDETVTDIDGNEYGVVLIGNQYWMAENLKVTKYRNGNSISGVWAYDNDENNVPIYGRLYSWPEVNKHVTETDPGFNIAPEGWHVPTDAEWTQMQDYLTSSGHSGTEGEALKSTTGWSRDGNGTDDYGFAALPGGYRNDEGTFIHLEFALNFWTSSEDIVGTAWSRWIMNTSTIQRESPSENRAHSIRCVRD